MPECASSHENVKYRAITKSTPHLFFGVLGDKNHVIFTNRDSQFEPETDFPQRSAANASLILSKDTVIILDSKADK